MRPPVHSIQVSHPSNRYVVLGVMLKLEVPYLWGAEAWIGFPMPGLNDLPRCEDTIDCASTEGV